MKNGKVRTERLAACLMVFALLGAPGLAAAAEMKHGEMKHGEMKHGEMKGMEGHGDMMKMGDKVFGGKVGPWDGEARLVDMKAQMEKAKASGMKMEGVTKTHHLAIGLTDPKTKHPISVTEGTGTVTVTGPDRKEEKTNFMVMQGHFGADVNLPKPGKYTFRTEVETGGKKGSAAFSHTVK